MSGQNSSFIRNWLEAANRTTPAISDRAGEWSFLQVTRYAEAIARNLLADARFKGRGHLESARVGLLVEPGAGFVASFLGVLLAGGTVVVFSPLHPKSESEYFCQDAEVAILIHSGLWKNRVLEFAHQIPQIEVETVFNSQESSFFEGASVLRHHERFLPCLDDHSPALQLYTSGTTGKPKGAILSHGNLAIQQKLLSEAWGLLPTDILLHTLPLHHMHGLCIALWSVLGAGGKIQFSTPFDAEQVWDQMEKSTVFMAVPTIYAKLLSHLEKATPEKNHLWKAAAKNLRLATSGSAALPVTLAEKWREISGHYPLERFGMTEVGVALSNPLLGVRRPGSVGMPLPSVQWKIMKDGNTEGLPLELPGQDIDSNQEEAGELWIGGPSVFLEYFKKPEANQSAFVELDGVRFFKTGDRVLREPDGYFRILGRNSVDILKSGGYKLSAIEIEEVFREHCEVSEVAVVGLPDEVWGDTVVACIVLKSDSKAAVSEVSLIEFAKTQLASYKVPKRIVFLDRLPCNALGKVMKPELVKLIFKKQT